MPDLVLPSDGFSDATVTRWLRRSGDRLAAGDELVELETEAALVVVEVTQELTLADPLVAPGQTVFTGTPLARVELAATNSATPDRTAPTEQTMAAKDSTSDAKNAVPILMPQAGNTMEEGTVVNWMVQEGDTIAVGQTICEIETDKATIDFESPQAGRLARIVAQVGEPIAVKEPIAILADNDVDADALASGGQSSSAQTAAKVVSAGPAAASTATTSPASGAGRQTAATTVDGRVKASPAARKLAAERHVSLSAVPSGSGPGGRILSTDVARAAAGNGTTPTTPSGDASRRPISKMRRAIGINLQASKQSIPHFYVRLTIDADPLLTFQREQKPQTACTLNDVLVLAVGRAIGEFPAVRSQIDGNDLVEFPHANIGIAVGIDEGLVVPVVLAVDTLSLAGLAKESKRVVENARRGRLENIGQGVFTISNLGMFGVEEFGAIINPPESGILAVSAIREAVVVENGALRAGRTMTLTLSADHRIVDGVLAAKFMARLKEILEHPADEFA